MAMSKRETEAVARTGCPACKQKAGTMCVYLPPKYTPRYYGPVTEAKLAKVGTPMKRPHYQRTNKMTDLERKARSRQRLQEAIASTPPAIRSLGAFDQREHEKMRVWLRANWRLFLLRKPE